MNHKTFKEWLYLAISDEIDKEQERLLKKHIDECDECRTEFDELTQMMTVLGESGVPEPSERMLWEARRDLMDAVAKESPMQSILGRAPSVPDRERITRSPGFWEKVSMGWFGGYRLALSGAATLAIGFFLGYAVFRADAVAPVDVAGPGTLQGETGRTDITNVRFVDVDPSDGTIELVYDLVRPVRLRAGVDDKRMQRMLAYALVNEENPGVRLQAIDAIGTDIPVRRSDGIRRALIEALKTDPNAGVRRQAFLTLDRMPFDTDIKDACLYVLTNDDNPGLRVSSINKLARATLDGFVEGEEVYDALKAEMELDGSGYLKTHSSAFIQEVNDAR